MGLAAYELYRVAGAWDVLVAAGVYAAVLALLGRTLEAPPETMPVAAAVVLHLLGARLAERDRDGLRGLLLTPRGAERLPLARLLTLTALALALLFLMVPRPTLAPSLASTAMVLGSSAAIGGLAAAGTRGGAALAGLLALPAQVPALVLLGHTLHDHPSTTLLWGYALLTVATAWLLIPAFARAAAQQR